MINRKAFTTFVLLVLLFPVLFVSGCTEKLSAEEIAAQMRQKEASIQDSSYTMHMTSYFGEQAQETELRILEKKPNKLKSFVKEPGKEEVLAGISDGKFMWTYDPKTNTVMKMKLPDTPDPGEMDYTGIIREFLNDTEVSLIGVEDVDKRPTYVLETSPKEEKEGFQLVDRFKLWVDKETWMPLRYEMYDSNGNLTIKTEIRDLKVNTGIADSEFEFKIPEGATVKTVDLDSFKFSEQMTLEEAKEQAGFEILVPEYLPEGYAFSHATAYNNSEIVPDGQAAEAVILTYKKGNDSIVITETVYEGKAPDTAVMNSPESVSINGKEGKCLSLRDMTILNWKLGDIYLCLSASIDKAELLIIAESISEKA